MIKPENLLCGEKLGTGFMYSCPSCGGSYSSLTALRFGRRLVPITKANECMAMRIIVLTDKREISHEGAWLGLVNWKDVMMPCNKLNLAQYLCRVRSKSPHLTIPKAAKKIEVLVVPFNLASSK